MPQSLLSGVTMSSDAVLLTLLAITATASASTSPQPKPTDMEPVSNNDFFAAVTAALREPTAKH
jgi:hypothetical protein